MQVYVNTDNYEICVHIQGGFHIWYLSFLNGKQVLNFFRAE